VNGILSMVSGFPTDMNVASLPPVLTLRNRPDVVAGEPALVANPGFDQYFNLLAEKGVPGKGRQPLSPPQR